MKFENLSTTTEDSFEFIKKPQTYTNIDIDIDSDFDEQSLFLPQKSNAKPNSIDDLFNLEKQYLEFIDDKTIQNHINGKIENKPETPDIPKVIKHSAVGQKGYRVSMKKTIQSKTNHDKILQRRVKNLHVKFLPKNFSIYDIENMLFENRESLLVVNHPYNCTKRQFFDYCFILMDNERDSAQFCEKWDHQHVMDCRGFVDKIQIFEGIQKPRDFLMKIFKSKSIKNRVKYFFMMLIIRWILEDQNFILIIFIKLIDFLRLWNLKAVISVIHSSI